MKRAISTLVVMFLVLLMITGAAMATGNGAHEGANEADHPHPEGVEHASGQGHGGTGGTPVGLIAGAIGIPALVAAGYLYRRRQKNE